MLLGGDELGRTQGGNNNAYNQDSPVCWYDWSNVDEDLLEFVRRLIRLRHDHPTFRRTAWLHEHADAAHDHVGWFTPDGAEMTTAKARSTASRPSTVSRRLRIDPLLSQ